MKQKKVVGSGMDKAYVGPSAMCVVCNMETIVDYVMSLKGLGYAILGNFILIKWS